MAHTKKTKRIVISIVAVLVLVLVAAQVITGVMINANFSQRFSSLDDEFILQFDKFQTMSRVQADFKSDKKQNLRGYFYSSKEQTEKHKALIVLNHGYGGGGHSYYLPQIEYLTQNGYLVFAFDKTGTDESEGENVRGLPQGIIDLQYALDFIRTQEQAKGLDLFLYGHSWGGYSVCSVLSKETDIKAVVSLSGFNMAQDMLIDQGVKIYGGIVKALSPFMWVYNTFLFGNVASMSSLDGLTDTQAEVLLFHSADDPVISIENSFDLYQEKLNQRENLHFVRHEDKGHSVFIEGNDYKNLDMKTMGQIVKFYDEVAAQGKEDTP